MKYNVESLWSCTLMEEIMCKLSFRWGQNSNAEMQRDLGVLMQDILKVNLQIESVVKKANAMLAFISREYRI